MTETELERYIDLYRTSVYTAALCRCGNPSDADDAVQDVFLKLYTCGKEFNDDEHVKAWLLRCTINRCADIKRSHWNKFSVPLDEAGEKVHYDSKDLGQSALIEAIGKLDGVNRTVFYLYYSEGYSVSEIAEIMKMSGTAVRSRIARTRNRLKKLLEDEGSL